MEVNYHDAKASMVFLLGFLIKNGGVPAVHFVIFQIVSTFPH